MFAYAILLLTLLIAVLAIRVLYAGLRRRSVTTIAAAISLGAFIYLYGAWVYLSDYTRYLFLAGVVVALIAGMRKKKTAVQQKRHYGLGIIAVFSATLALLYFTGIHGRPKYADLQFPLHHGTYYVLQGGKGLPANAFHYGAHHEIYAMDIVRLDSRGRRCRGIFSKSLHDYYIFGDTVFSPCNGVVRRAVGTNPDNIPPARVAGLGKLNGVLVESAEYFVFLGHLEQDMVFVKAGDSVIAGQPLGLAGNSGMSIEPHLHVQVHEKSGDGRPWYDQPPLFMRFGGRIFLLFQTIHSST